MPSSTKKTLADFGYEFNDAGKLQDLKTNKAFVFDVYDGDHKKNQMRYEELGQVIEEHVYKLLEDEGKLHRTTIPLDCKEDEGRSFIFESEDARTAEKVLLLIHGSGVVRAGQWSRKLIINHSLESGSQLPYIHKARELGYGIFVLNSNNKIDNVRNKIVRGSENPEQHFNYVWKNVISRSKANHVAIVAHSYGGVITVNGAIHNPDVAAKTFAVAFTDSVHSVMNINKQENLSKWLSTHACNWVSSKESLDTRLSSREGDCMRVSAGTNVHEETSWKAFDSVWKFINQKFNELVTQPGEDEEMLSQGRDEL